MIDWIATALTIVSVYMMGDKNRWAFIIAVISNILWIIFSVITGQIPLLITNIVLLVMDIRGLIKWSKVSQTEVKKC